MAAPGNRPDPPSDDDLRAALAILERAGTADLQRLGWHVQPNDFYSPLNDLAFLAGNRDLWTHGRTPADIDWRPNDQLETARLVGRYVEELRDVPADPSFDPVAFGWNNNFWNNADALVQYGLLRHLKPKRVVEIGCGWSSLLLARALQANGTACEVDQVEPHPNRAIFSVLPEAWRHHHTILQRAPFELFTELGAGDVLFYDGSHCAKAASDVVWFFFEVLPRVRPGVIIHLHDVFYPDDYPEEWIFERGQTWNEQYLLQAFLMHNNAYRVRIANRFLWKAHRAELERLYAGVQPSHGCSIWLEKAAT